MECDEVEEKEGRTEGRKGDARRTQMTLAMSVEDKRRLKGRAAERDTTVAALVHEWVASWGDARGDVAEGAEE